MLLSRSVADEMKKLMQQDVYKRQDLEDGIYEIKAAFESGRISDYGAALYSNVKYLKQHGSPLQTDVLGSQVMAALAQKA